MYYEKNLFNGKFQVFWGNGNIQEETIFFNNYVVSSYTYEHGEYNKIKEEKRIQEIIKYNKSIILKINKENAQSNDGEIEFGY
jgi:hypothetical protein